MLTLKNTGPITGMSPSSGILIGEQRAGVVVGRRRSCGHQRVVAEAGEPEREHVEHHAEHDLVHQVPDREHGEQRADQAAGEHRAIPRRRRGCARRDAPSAPANAPASICPSIATLITPERSQRMPASAPRIERRGQKIVLLQQADDVDAGCPAAGARPAQERHHEEHSSTAASTQRICGGENPRTTCHAPSAHDDHAEHHRGRRRAGIADVGHGEPRRLLRSPNVGVAVGSRRGPTRRCMTSPATMSDAAGDQPRAQSGPRRRRRAWTTTSSSALVAGHGCGACSSVPPLRQPWPTPPPRDSRSRKIGRISAGRRDEQHDHRLDAPAPGPSASRCRPASAPPPARSAPNSSPASTMPPRLARPEQRDGDRVEADAGVDVAGERTCWCRGSALEPASPASAPAISITVM